MNLISSITDYPLQEQTIVLPNGKTFNFTLYFQPQQYGWFITNLTYDSTFTLNGLRVCNSPNMLYQWTNIIPFGLACFSTNNREPSLQQDFSSGASQLFVLTQDECLAYVAYIQSGTQPA